MYTSPYAHSLDYLNCTLVLQALPLQASQSLDTNANNISQADFDELPFGFIQHGNFLC